MIWNYTNLTDLQPVPLDSTIAMINGTSNGTPVDLAMSGQLHTISQILGLDLVLYVLVLIACELFPIMVYCIRRTTPKPKE